MVPHSGASRQFSGQPCDTSDNPDGDDEPQDPACNAGSNLDSAENSTEPSAVKYTPKNGFVMISHTLVDRIAWSKLSGRLLRLLLVIIDETCFQCPNLAEVRPQVHRGDCRGLRDFLHGRT